MEMDILFSDLLPKKYRLDIWQVLTCYWTSQACAEYSFGTRRWHKSCN